MSSIFRQQKSPLTEEAWQHVERTVRETLTARLTARRIVDVDGPHGLSYAAVNLGRLGAPQTEGHVNYALRKVQPLLEVRVPFELSVWELDNLARGATDVDTDAAIQAALHLADFEERVIYEGLNAAGIAGISAAKSHPPIKLAQEPADVVRAAGVAVERLHSAGVAGPYALVLPQAHYAKLVSDISTYPPRKRADSLLGGGPVLPVGFESPNFGFVISLRGGDVTLSLGQDATLGYDHHDAQTVKLYLTESFTVRTLGPEAVVVLEPSG